MKPSRDIEAFIAALEAENARLTSKRAEDWGGQVALMNEELMRLEAENAGLRRLRQMLDERDVNGKYTYRAGLMRFLVVDDGSVSARIAKAERLLVAWEKLDNRDWHMNSEECEEALRRATLEET